MLVAVIRNRSAGDAESEKALTGPLRARGHHVDVFGVDEEEIAAALALNADVVVVAGGDGTVGRVASRVAGGPLVMAIVLSGTANNIGRSAGAFPSAESLAQNLETGAPRIVDSGLLSLGAQRIRFFESVGCGLLTRLMKELESRSKRARMRDRERGFRREVEVLRELLQSAPAIEIGIDGKSDRFVLLEVMNTRTIGPDLPFSAEGAMDDGLLDLVYVHDQERLLLDEFLRCRIEGKAAPPLPMRQVRQIDLRCHAEDLHVDDNKEPLDGEMLSTAISVVPRSLRVISP